ncbi:MAG TPA: peptide chain release factor N(5)-glutamine methyltransferase [Bacteroidetes bacterium]|nr:peptide chain release factor N(5)-glutamine methyltransferase [Bacteroidota bacterium]
MKSKHWRLAELIKTSVELFKKHQIENARLNAELLLAHTLQMDRVRLYLNYDRPLNEVELTTYRNLVRRRLTDEPMQYILGKTEFMSLPFKVTPAVLIPRPDTETLVEWVIETCRTGGKKWILDIGTGSGNIAVSLAHYLPFIHVVAIDVSPAALRIAAANCRENNCTARVHFFRSNFTHENFVNVFQAKFDYIVSNPPYIPEHEFEFLSGGILKHEPHLALRDGEQNGYYYQKIAGAAARLLKEDGAVFVEIGHKQADPVKEIFASHGFRFIDLRRDLAGIERVLQVGRNDRV